MKKTLKMILTTCLLLLAVCGASLSVSARSYYYQGPGFFFGSHPKKEPKKCFPDYRMRHRKIRKDVAFQNKYISSRQR